MKVKICGITSIRDAVMCEEAGADMLGFVHVTGRSRSVPLDRISEICSSIGDHPTRLLVCYPESTSQAIDLCRVSGVDGIQSHTLSPNELAEIHDAGFMVIRAVRPVRSEALAFADSVDAILFEGGTPGTGTTYDYSIIPMDCHSRSIIAGGLTPENVHLAKALDPYAVDVSSGVEHSLGVKDGTKLSEFMRRCRE